MGYLPGAFAKNDVAPNATVSPKWIIGITGGSSIPFGNFTKTDFTNPDAGFAAAGGNIGLTGTYMLNKHIGISALASYHRYGVKGLQTLADGFKESFALDSTTVDTKGSNYSLNLLIGPIYSFSVGKKKNISIDSRILAGFVSAHLAGNQVFFEDQAASTFSQNTATANTFGLQLGSGARYSVSTHVGVSLNVDYFYSKPDFQISYENRNNNAGRWVKNYNQPINGLNTNLSIVYLLSRS